MGFFSWILYIVIAILVLLFMITVHEFGHWTAGKLLKFKINEFSVGFGKAIFQRTNKNGEKFSIRVFPLGGYCAFEGEDEAKEVNVKGAFDSMAPWKRLIVLFMGAFFNFLSALLFASIFLMAFGYADKVQVKTVDFPSGASVSEENWLQKGDVIVAVNGEKTDFVYDRYFISMIEVFDVGETFSVTVKRGGKQVDLLEIGRNWFLIEEQQDDDFGKIFVGAGTGFSYAVVEENSTLKIAKIAQDSVSYFTPDSESEGVVEIDGYKFLLTGDGVMESSLSIAKIGLTTMNYRYGFFEALLGTFEFCFKWVWKILIILWQLISGQIALSALGGTVTTVVTIAQVTSQNFANLLLLLPLISINLAVFNLLPIPALDGARMVFVAIEWVRGKPVNRKIEANIHFVGLMLLLAFVVMIDILHFLV